MRTHSLVRSFGQAALTIGAALALAACDQYAQADYRLPVAPASPDVPAGYRLVWHDEFQEDGLPDPRAWGYDTDLNYIGWGNAEQEFYTSGRRSNAECQGGLLHIRAWAEPSSEVVNGKRYDYAYTSARLTTERAAAWTYGFVEVRAKPPGGAGTWPAIWLLGANGVWPECGGTDVMEQWGTNPAVAGTFHVAGNNQTSGWAAPADLFGSFHRYQLLWTPAKMTIMVDGREVNSWTKDSSLAGAASFAQWPFDHPQYLLLNLAVGGNGNQTVDAGLFPRDFQIDYVRVYQK